MYAESASESLMDKGSMDASITAQWDRVQGQLREEFGDAAFKSWVAPMMVADVRDGAVTLAVPTRFIRDWVLTHYADRIRALWNGENPEVRTVDVTVVTGMPRHDSHGGNGVPATQASGVARAAAVESGRARTGAAVSRAVGQAPAVPATSGFMTAAPVGAVDDLSASLDAVIRLRILSSASLMSSPTPPPSAWPIRIK